MCDFSLKYHYSSGIQAFYSKKLQLTSLGIMAVTFSHAPTPTHRLVRGDEWSLRAFASMPSTAIFLRARAEMKNLLCELASNAKI